MKILDFFIFLWVIFALLDPDPDPDPTTQLNADPCGSGYGSGSETLGTTQEQVLQYLVVEYISDAVEYPRHWWKEKSQISPFDQSISNQCYGSGSGTFLTPGSQISDPGSPIPNHINDSFWVNKLQVCDIFGYKKVGQLSFVAVFGSGIWDLRSEIQDFGWMKNGSGINILDPQHC